MPGRSAQATAVIKKFQTILELVEEVNMLYFRHPGINWFERFGDTENNNFKNCL